MLKLFALDDVRKLYTVDEVKEMIRLDNLALKVPKVGVIAFSQYDGQWTLGSNQVTDLVRQHGGRLV